MVNVALRSGRIIMQNVGRYLKKIYNLIVMGKKKSFDLSQNLDSDEILHQEEAMKILIISDTHRQHESLKKVLKKEGKIDKLIHLGDVEGYEDYIKELAGCPVEMVAGNNDFFSSLEKEKEIRIGKYKVLLMHGHYYYVSMETSMIKQEAISRGCSIVMYGHTHKPVIEYDPHVIALNPGSLSYPRQKNRKPSYIIMNVDEKGEATFEICYL